MQRHFHIAAVFIVQCHYCLIYQMVHYYLSCKVSRENVLTAELRNAQRAVVAVRQALALLSRGAPQLFNDPGNINCVFKKLRRVANKLFG